MQENENKNNEKWDFSDYAFTITGILVGVLLVGPELLESFADITILGGSFANIVPTDIGAALEGDRIFLRWSIAELRAFSPMLFLLTTTIVMFKEAIDARKTGGYKGSLFTHTFESLLEDAIYMAITTVMVYGAMLAGAMYASWLAGPITWILFIFIFPLVRNKKSGNTQEAEEAHTPWLLLVLFAVGVVAEIITRQWIAFPLTWLVICAIKLIEIIREDDKSTDTIFNIIYYSFSVILMTVGILFNFWIMSWIAFPIALFICWIASKVRKQESTDPSQNPE